MNYGEELLNKLQSNKSKSDVKRIADETEGTLIGSGIGAMVGLFIGYQRKQNLLMSAFIGAALGGITSKIFIRKK